MTDRFLQEQDGETTLLRVDGVAHLGVSDSAVLLANGLDLPLDAAITFRVARLPLSLPPFLIGMGCGPIGIALAALSIALLPLLLLWIVFSWSRSGWVVEAVTPGGGALALTSPLDRAATTWLAGRLAEACRQDGEP